MKTENQKDLERVLNILEIVVDELKTYTIMSSARRTMQVKMLQSCSETLEKISNIEKNVFAA